MILNMLWFNHSQAFETYKKLRILIWKYSLKKWKLLFVIEGRQEVWNWTDGKRLIFSILYSFLNHNVLSFCRIFELLVELSNLLPVYLIFMFIPGFFFVHINCKSCLRRVEFIQPFRSMFGHDKANVLIVLILCTLRVWMFVKLVMNFEAFLCNSVPLQFTLYTHQCQFVTSWKIAFWFDSKNLT